MRPDTLDPVARVRRAYAGYAQSGRAARWGAENPGNRAIVAEFRAVLARALLVHGFLPLSGGRVLEIGCGSGSQLAWLGELGARPADRLGMDLLPEPVSLARARFPELKLALADGAHLPIGRSRFDLVVLCTVMSSVPSGAPRVAVAREAARVLVPGGAVLWYDLRVHNPGNRNVSGIGRRQLQALFPGFRLSVSPCTLLPPLARRLGVTTAALYPRLVAGNLLLTHLAGLLHKPL